MSYQQRTGFRSTLDFDREYLWNGSSNRQAENGVVTYVFFHIWWKWFGKRWSTNEEMALTFDQNFDSITTAINKTMQTFSFAAGIHRPSQPLAVESSLSLTHTNTHSDTSNGRLHLLT